MSEKQIAKSVAIAVGAALAGSFAITGVANADTGVSPFALTTLSTGYMLGAGEGKCGGDKGDKGEEGSCGGDKGEEGSCGGDKEGEGEDKGEEGKCGEGKCGGSV